MFHTTKILVYRGVDILLVQQEDDDKLYIPRDCIRRALKYTNSGQLSKMQSRYNGIFQTEYIRDFNLKGSDESIASGTGLYTIRGVIEVCSHTQKFRGSDGLLSFLKNELGLMGVNEEFPEISKIMPLSVFEKTERELFIQMSLQLGRIEKILQVICNKITEGESDESTEENN